jgi:hypothetical protein
MVILPKREVRATGRYILGVDARASGQSSILLTFV